MRTFVTVVSEAAHEGCAAGGLIETVLACRCREYCSTVVIFATQSEQEAPHSFAGHLFTALRDQGSYFTICTPDPPECLAAQCQFALNVARTSRHRVVLATTAGELFAVQAACRRVLGDLFRSIRNEGVLRFAFRDPSNGRVCVV